MILLLELLTTCALRNPIGMTFGHTALDPLLRILSINLLLELLTKQTFRNPARRELHPRYARPFAVRFVDDFDLVVIDNMRFAQPNRYDLQPYCA